MYKKILLFILVSVNLHASDNFSYVVTTSGLRVREEPNITSKTLFILPHKTNVKILQKGKEDKVNNKINYWYRISFYNDEGWVFGEYIKNQIPDNFKHKYAYKSEDNDSAKIFFIIFRDNTFSIYAYLTEYSSSIILKGTWFEKDKFIFFKFNDKQNCDPDCNPSALFNDKTENITLMNDGSYKMSKDIKEITIWNILCPNVNYWPLFQYR